MLIKVYKRCYDFVGRDEYKVIPYGKCPLCFDNFNESEMSGFCFGGFVWIGDKKPEYSVEKECKYYDKDSFKVYDNCVECNFDFEVKNDK